VHTDIEREAPNNTFKIHECLRQLLVCDTVCGPQCGNSHSPGLTRGRFRQKSDINNVFVSSRPSTGAILHTNYQ